MIFPRFRPAFSTAGNQKIHAVVGIGRIGIRLFVELGAIVFLKLQPLRIVARRVDRRRGHQAFCGWPGELQ